MYIKAISEICLLFGNFSLFNLDRFSQSKSCVKLINSMFYNYRLIIGIPIDMIAMFRYSAGQFPARLLTCLSNIGHIVILTTNKSHKILGGRPYVL